MWCDDQFSSWEWTENSRAFYTRVSNCFGLRSHSIADTILRARKFKYFRDGRRGMYFQKGFGGSREQNWLAKEKGEKILKIRKTNLGEWVFERRNVRKSIFLGKNIFWKGNYLEGLERMYWRYKGLGNNWVMWSWEKSEKCFQYVVDRWDCLASNLIRLLTIPGTSLRFSRGILYFWGVRNSVEITLAICPALSTHIHKTQLLRRAVRGRRQAAATKASWRKQGFLTQAPKTPSHEGQGHVPTQAITIAWFLTMGRGQTAGAKVSWRKQDFSI